MKKYRVTRFKRIYIEITSSCNLTCSFCQETKRDKRFMSLDEFSHVIDQVKPLTEFIYLHVKGEPLLHPQLGDILQICHDEGMRINITTNGTLLKKQLDTLIAHPVHQINISMHSADDNDCIDMNTYFKNITECCNMLNEKTDTEISLRLWTTLQKPNLFGQKNLTIRKKLYINVQSPFECPILIIHTIMTEDLSGITHTYSILSDGTVVPCCLDGNACISLGNIFVQDISEILEQERTQNFIRGFRDKRAVEPLCCHCSFKERFSHKM